MYLGRFELVDKDRSEAFPMSLRRRTPGVGHEVLHLGSSAPIPIGDNGVATECARDIVQKLCFASLSVGKLPPFQLSE
jgi:hypothetical protein